MGDEALHATDAGGTVAIAEAHGGRVAVASRPGATTFTLTLGAPLAPGRAAAPAPELHAAAGAA